MSKVCTASETSEGRQSLLLADIPKHLLRLREGLGLPFSLFSWNTLAQSGAQAAAKVAPLPKLGSRKPRNIVFILTDDHRYDALGFMAARPIRRRRYCTASPATASTSLMHLSPRLYARRHEHRFSRAFTRTSTEWWKFIRSARISYSSPSTCNAPATRRHSSANGIWATMREPHHSAASIIG